MACTYLARFLMISASANLRFISDASKSRDLLEPASPIQESFVRRRSKMSGGGGEGGSGSETGWALRMSRVGIKEINRIKKGSGEG